MKQETRFLVFTVFMIFAWIVMPEIENFLGLYPKDVNSLLIGMHRVVYFLIGVAFFPLMSWALHRESQKTKDV